MTNVYLDQKDISNLAKGQVDTKWANLLRTRVDNGDVAVVLSLFHAYETAMISGGDLRQKIVAYVDSLPSKRWLQSWSWIEREEVARCFAEDTQGVTQPPVAALVASRQDVYRLPGQVSRQPSSEDEFGEFVGALDPTRSKHAQKMKEMQAAWPAQRRTARDWGSGTTVTSWFRTEVLWTFVPERTSAGLILSEKVQRDYASKLDLARCPSLSLARQVEDKWHADTDASAETGDIPDLMMHPYAAVYCDMVTLESRMHNTILQTKAGKVLKGKIALNLQEALTKLGYAQ